MIKKWLQQRLQILRTYSFRAYVFSAGCCQPEIDAVRSSVYNWERLGVFEVKEPEVADLLIVSGWIEDQYAEVLKSVYEKMAGPKYVMAVGACAVSGSTYLNMDRKIVSDLFPVDMLVPGCPPRPELILDGIEGLRRKLHPSVDQRKVLQSAMKHSE